MKLRFDVVDDTDEDQKPVKAGRFSRDWNEEEGMDSVQDELDAGRIDLNEAIVRARKLLAEYPENMEIHNFLGVRLWDAGLRDEASEIWGRGHQIGYALLPHNFKGRISWNDLDNRSFLRVSYGHMLGLCHREQPKKSLALANKLLRWNSSDNQGVRLLVGDLKLSAGDYDGAMKSFLMEAPAVPTLWYRAGLIAFRRDDFVQACTYLRRGIAGNPYVAEGLTGRTLLADHLYWHCSSMYGCDWALDYLESPYNDWEAGEIDFLDWLFNCADVLVERAEHAQIQEGLTYEREGNKRVAYGERQARFHAGIDDRLSKKLVRRVKNSWNEEVWPWQRDAMAHSLKARQVRVNAGAEVDIRAE
jgi:tetratricopeptide (TPR) repeat protein